MVGVIDRIGLKISRFFLRRNLKRCGYSEEHIEIILDFYTLTPEEYSRRMKQKRILTNLLRRKGLFSKRVKA